MPKLWLLKGDLEAPGWNALRQDLKDEKVEIIHLDPKVWAMVEADEPPAGYDGLEATEPADGLYLDPNGSPLYVVNGAVVPSPRPGPARAGRRRRHRPRAHGPGVLNDGPNTNRTDRVRDGCRGAAVRNGRRRAGRHRGRFPAALGDRQRELAWVVWPLDELTVELSLGLSGHPIGTSGGLVGGIDGGTLWRIPVSAVAQYRPEIVDRLDPYVGLGLVYNVLVARMSSDYGQWLSDVDFDDELNLVAQVGISYALDHRWSANLDLRYMGLRTTGTFTALDGSELARVDFKLDPWVVALGFRVRY